MTSIKQDFVIEVKDLSSDGVTADFNFNFTIGESNDKCNQDNSSNGNNTAN